ncbi:uncharacterized protein Tco025E_08355 [Trypanosoma conorhini]|uniref:Uncharacterized protein n=1 Tax=Trypanosoma conorhini TaxID=83891 RepID=A0A3R7N9C7_9TRYP|nr:uncharacterized protein Tco025E_08355 [Trypanosoma conorhini]RNF02623.1 hypothetical protein Tco025E_08355 [Trypanosoma conorhini]
MYTRREPGGGEGGPPPLLSSLSPGEVHLVPLEPAVLTGTQPPHYLRALLRPTVKAVGARGRREEGGGRREAPSEPKWQHPLRQCASSAHPTGAGRARASFVPSRSASDFTLRSTVSHHRGGLSALLHNTGGRHRHQGNKHQGGSVLIVRGSNNPPPSPRAQSELVATFSSAYVSSNCAFQ